MNLCFFYFCGKFRSDNMNQTESRGEFIELVLGQMKTTLNHLTLKGLHLVHTSAVKHLTKEWVQNKGQKTKNPSKSP